MPTSEFLPLAFAAVPGLYAWWGGRRLVAHLDDPAFSELLMAHSGRVIKALAVAWAVTIVLAARQAAWALPLALIAVLIGGFPLHRRAFEEQWSLVAFLEHQIRVGLGVFGSWFLILLAPALFSIGVVPTLITAAVLVTVVTAWNVFGSAVLLRLVRATPLHDEMLSKRFDEILARAACRKPVVYRAGTNGGRWVNGFALPTPWAPAVLLTDDLVRNLEPAEITAIFAHEVAHLEQFTPGRWLARSMIAPILAVVISVTYLLVVPAGSNLSPLFIFWPLICVVALVAMFSRSRRDETESDLRAVELTGDADAMIRALTKLHGLIRQPRRLDAKREQRVTHPSLARRLQAIRQASDRATTAADVDVLVVRSAEEDTVVLLLADRLQWLEGVPSDLDVPPETYWQHAVRTRSIAYAELAELRVDATRAERRDLVAVDVHGEKTAVRLRVEDAPRVQRFLDTIDHRLGAMPEANAKHQLALSPVPARWFAAIGILAGLIPPMSWAFSLASFLVLLKPVAPGLMAAGVIGALGLLSAWSNGTLLAFEVDQPGAAILPQAIVSVLFIGLGVIRWRSRIEESVRDVRAITAILLLTGLLGATVKLASFLGPLAAMHLHLWVRSGPSALLLLLGAATALVVQRGWLARSGGLSLGVLLAAALFAGTQSFRANSTGDLLRRPGPFVSLTSAAVEPIRTVTLHEMISELMLSPSGVRFAARVTDYAESDYRQLPMTFVVEGPDSVEHVSAIALRWASDTSVVTLTPVAGGLAVRHIALPGGPTWEVVLPDVANPQLHVRDGRWSVSSGYWSDAGFAELHGTIGSSDVLERRMRVFGRDDDASVSGSLVDLDGRVLVLGSVVQTGFLLPGALVGFGLPPLTTGLWVADSGQATALGTTAMLLSCLEYGSSAGGYSCTASSERSTELWRVNVVERTVRPVGRVPGWRWASGTSDAYVLQQWGEDLYVVDAEPFRIRVVARQDLRAEWEAADHGYPASEVEAPWELSTSYRNSTLAVATGNYDDAVVSFYRISDAGPKMDR